MITIFHFVICRKKIVFKRSIIPYFVLLSLIVLRIVLPIDSDAFFVLRSRYVLAALNEVLKIRIYKGFSVEDILYVTWFLGVIIALSIWNRDIKNDY